MHANACKDEQRGQRHPGRLNRVGSALTQEMKSVVGEKIGVPKVLPAVSAGDAGYATHKRMQGNGLCQM